MTLTWTKDGEEQNCKLHIVPYCDLEEPTHLTVSTMNGNNMEGCPLAQVDENTYRDPYCPRAHYQYLPAPYNGAA